MKQRKFAPVEEIPAQAEPKHKLAVSMPLQAMPSRATKAEPQGAEPPSPAPEITEVAQDDQAQFILINARHIDQNTYPPRQLYSEEAIKVLADSIREHGQRDAIHVIPHPDKSGHYIIGDGWTRVQAIRAYEINDGMVLARVHHNLSEVQASWLGFAQNEERSAQTDFDRAMFFLSQRKSGTSWESIATSAGFSKSRMSHFAAFERLSPDLSLLARNHAEKITSRAAYYLVLLQGNLGEVAALKVANKFVLEDRPQAWLAEQAEKKPTVEAVKRPGVEFKKKLGDGFIRRREDGRVDLSFKVPMERAEEFDKAIEELLLKFQHQDIAHLTSSPA